MIQNIITKKEKHITVHYDIQYNLHESALLYAGLIVNELATNAFKYAFESSGTLSISLKKKPILLPSML